MKSETKRIVWVIGIDCVRFLVHTTVVMKCTVFLKVTPCSLENTYNDLEEHAVSAMRIVM
jgi:hypothetical protein